MENEAWREVDTKASFSQELNISFVEGSDESITTEAQTFMMIPQTLPDDALIEMVFNDGNSDRILTGNIAAGVWPMGKTVVYKSPPLPPTGHIHWKLLLHERLTTLFREKIRAMQLPAIRKTPMAKGNL